MAAALGSIKYRSQINARGEDVGLPGSRACVGRPFLKGARSRYRCDR